MSSSAGVVYLTNRRIIYLPSSPTPALQSFAAPILNLHDTHVTAPWIGPNVWTAVLQPVQGGGIPPQHAALELKITFKDGGAFDFHTRYERVKERLQQAVEVARESGAVRGDGSERGRGRGGGALDGVNLDSVNLEELPAYEETGAAVPAPVGAQNGAPIPPPTVPPPAVNVETLPATSPRQEQQIFSPPSEPPPGYEEVQRESVEDELARRLSNARE